MTPRSAETPWKSRSDWAPLFAAEKVRGTLAVWDERTRARWVHDPARATRRYLPASTFKVPHTLFALDAGVARDEFQRFRWDGVRRRVDAWNQDQTLRTAMRHSTVWVYQRFARTLGERRERAYLKRIGYGNADVSGGVERFWLDGGLRISAREQIDFLRRLHRNTLPFSGSHQRLVKDLMVVEARRDWILRAKTGWTTQPDPDIGWWVGWVDRLDGAVFFALNLDMPRGNDDAPKRERIVRKALASIDALS